MKREIAKTEYYIIEVDEIINRMYLTIIGYWPDPSMVPDYIKDISDAMGQLSQGFTILTDVTNFNTPPQSVAEIHLSAQKILMNGGLSKTAEVILKDKVIEKAVINEYSSKSGMVKSIFNDINEAEAWLNKD